MKFSLKAILVTTLKFAFAFGIIVYMVWSGRLDLAIVRQGFSEWKLMSYSMILIISAFAASLYRWQLLMLGQSISFPFTRVIRFGWIGAFFNTTMPGAVSGDLIKAWYVLNERKGPKTPVLTTILLDRLFGVFGLVFVSAAPLFMRWSSVIASPNLKGIAMLVALMLASVLVFFLYMMLSVWGPLAYVRRKLSFLESYKFGKIVLQAHDAITSYRDSPSILLKSLLLSMCTHFCIVLVTILCAQALKEDQLTLYQYFMLVPLGMLTTAIPIAPAGLGVGHVAFGGLFRSVGSNHGAEIFTLYVTVQILFNILGVFFYLSSPKVRPLPEESIAS